MKNLSYRWLFAAAVLTVAAQRPLAAQAAGPAEAGAKRDAFQGIEPLLREYCFRCHGRKRQRRDLDLEAAFKVRPLVRNLELWTNVIRRLEAKEMPPEDEEQPAAAERRELLDWLDRSVVHFDYSKVKDPGHEPIRRLTHTEYGRTVRDLFGVEVDVTGKFPIDLSGTSGFDNSANTLFLQGPLLERYIHVADHVVEQALPESAESAGQKRSRELVFVSRPTGETSSEEAARAILERFLLRAYRRPATRSEVDAFMDQFRRARQSGEEFESAVKRTLKVVLISPNFLLRIEAGRETDEAYRVGEWELASRLSYFLWASMPDDELFELARRKRLRDPAVLRRQVRRMLAEPRAKTLGSVFAAQWLGFEHIGTRVRLDPIDNPWCTDTLMHAMKEESALFFLSLVQENSPISRLVDADYTYLNEELARHYEIDGVRGARLRRVALDNPNRGGIFGQASLLAVTSFPHRTSPVVRGKWILADVLGTPPPPPPPDAGEFSEEVREKRRLTLREKLEIHRENPRCNACHQEIDPLGFSLENFGRFGRWRTSIRGRPIDAKGRLPDGTEFEGPVGLKKIIVERRMPDLVRQISRKMLSYALGRQLEYYDEPAVRKIVRTLEENDYRFGTLIDEVVTSYPFQFKKNPKKNRKKDRKKDREKDREKSGSPGKVKRF